MSRAAGYDCIAYRPDQLPPGHDFYDLQAVARAEQAGGKFRRRDGLAVVFNHHASRQQLAAHEELLQGAGKQRGNGLTVGDYGRLAN